MSQPSEVCCLLGLIAQTIAFTVGCCCCCSCCRGARGRKLTPLEAHDLVCKVAEIVVVGGVRR